MPLGRFAAMVVASKSPQPSPIPPLSPQPKRPEFAGPPVRRVLRLHDSLSITIPTSRAPSLHGMAMFQRYMRVRPFSLSGGVMKFTLLNPEPSCAFAMVPPLSAPPCPKLCCWKLSDSEYLFRE